MKPHLSSRKAFSLVELIVVIAIIGILAGVLLASFRGSSESAQAAKCLANLKNLANACQTYGPANTDLIYPKCCATEYRNVSLGKNSIPEITYKEHKGWISWNSEGHYQNGKSASTQNNPTIGFRTSDEKQGVYALTNGCLWTYVARNRETYVCPAHVKKCGKKGRPYWSYLMNAKFNWVKFGDLARADRFLLFSEIPFQSWHTWIPDGTGTGTDDDPVLQHPGKPSKGHETIGANHCVGKDLYAHVAFADGHVEKLRIPHTGTSKKLQVEESVLKDLSEWLGEGIDVSFDGKKYKKMDN